jgi:hypothetical protein
MAKMLTCGTLEKFMTTALFVWLISYQPTVHFSQNKSATSNQPTILFSQNKSAPATSYQPNEQARVWKTLFSKKCLHVGPMLVYDVFSELMTSQNNME